MSRQESGPQHVDGAPEERTPESGILGRVRPPPAGRLAAAARRSSSEVFSECDPGGSFCTPRRYISGVISEGNPGETCRAPRGSISELFSERNPGGANGRGKMERVPGAPHGGPDVEEMG
eukprot:9060012-Pyramimonas_sp.AAC.1